MNIVLTSFDFMAVFTWSLSYLNHIVGLSNW